MTGFPKTRLTTEQLETREVPALLGIAGAVANLTPDIDARADVVVALSGQKAITADVAAAVNLGIDLNPKSHQPPTGLTLSLLGKNLVSADVRLPSFNIDARLGLWAEAGLSPNVKVGDLITSLKGTVHAALSLGDCVKLGGTGVNGLLREAVTAVVNARIGHGYPYSCDQIISSVNAAITGKVHATITTLIGQLSHCNKGCDVTPGVLCNLLNVRL